MPTLHRFSSLPIWHKTDKFVLSGPTMWHCQQWYECLLHHKIICSNTKYWMQYSCIQDSAHFYLCSWQEMSCRPILSIMLIYRLRAVNTMPHATNSQLRSTESCGGPWFFQVNMLLSCCMISVHWFLAGPDEGSLTRGYCTSTDDRKVLAGLVQAWTCRRPWPRWNCFGSLRYTGVSLLINHLTKYNRAHAVCTVGLSYIDDL